MNLGERIARDEVLDRARIFGLTTVQELARLLRVPPQLIYYRIRLGRLHKKTCPTCGTGGLIDFREALATFPKQAKALQEEEGEGWLDMESLPSR